MAIVKVPTNFNIDLEFEIPEFYRRFIALILDWVLIIIYLKIAEIFVRSYEESHPAWEGDNWEDLHWLKLVVYGLPPLIYHVVFELAMRGQTVGKKLMGIRVVNENGGRASASQLLIRWLLREVWFLLIGLISLQYEYFGKKDHAMVLLLIVLGYFIADIVLVVSSKKGQRLGDVLAKTILIRTNTTSSIEETVFQEVADSYVPQFPQIMRLSDRDINAIKSILQTAHRKGDAYMAESAAAKIKAHLKIDTDMNAFDFLGVLLKDYNYLSVK